MAAALLTAACGDKAQQKDGDQVVLIGQASPLTGPQAHLGKDNENGARMALDEINAAGLTLGGGKSCSKCAARTMRPTPKPPPPWPRSWSMKA